MKKIGFGILAVALAVAGSAFMVPKRSANLVYYFQLDDAGNPENTSQTPPTSNTFSCPGRLVPCSAGYPSYTQLANGQYQATGTMVSGTEEYVGD